MRRLFTISLGLLFLALGEINAQCTADFNSQSQSCNGFNVLFSATDTSGTLTYIWNFGDTASGLSNTDSMPQVAHVFSIAGTYDVRLIVMDTNSCTDTVSKSIVIFANSTADFSIQSTRCEDVPVQFNAIDTANSNAYYWDFGDVFSGIDNWDSVANPIHLFSKTGDFTIKLIVINAGGCSDTVSKSIVMLPKVLADFRWMNSCKDISTSFSDSSKAGLGDSLISWEWNLGNSTLASVQNPQVVYSGTGNYNVELIVLSQGGCTDTIRKIVRVFGTPNGSSDNHTGCENALINFTADTLTGAISYQWDFGDGSFFSVRNASHVYLNSGYFEPQLRVDFGTAKCAVYLDSIFIRALPDASFSTWSAIQCFNENEVCVKLNKQNQGIKSRTVLFDDGNFDDFSPLSDSIICHNYTNASGGQYFISMELIDSNDCISTYTDSNAFLVHPVIKADFDFTGGNGCFTTNVFLTNTSNTAPPMVRDFVWDFGDGAKDSSNWTDLNYTYTADGSFKITLSVTDTNGCTDSFIDAGLITNTSFVVDAMIDSSSGHCKNDNYFHFTQTPIENAIIIWSFAPTILSTNFSTAYRFPYPGIHYPQVTISKNGCDSTRILDSILIYGPTAVIGNITNRYQCQIKDTVYYTNASVPFQNQNLQVFWDAGDFYASSCTLSTKDSINVGLNCPYSTDSLLFKHMYQKGQEGCYYTKLVVEDTIVGCRDSVYAAIPLMEPKAQGLFTPSDSSPCSGPEPYKTLTFNLNESQPSCLKYAWWVMWDSLKASGSGNFDSFWSPNSLGYNYRYDNYAGDSNGKVTIGLIVENGRDTNGNVCRDTGWFHNSVQVTHMSPMFTSNYDSKKYYCENSRLQFYPLDSNQSAGSRFIWNFGDGTILDTADQHSVSHVFKESGKYRVRLSVINPSGCRGDSSIWINIGVSKHFTLLSDKGCVQESFQLFEQNRYYDTFPGSYRYWGDTLRALSGQEELRYDLGDGNGYQNLGPNPSISYLYPGTYNIAMAVKDSAGCWDTLSGLHAVRVGGVYADFLLPEDSFLCGQTLDMKSLATTIDSTVMNGLDGDSIVSWEWDFGKKYPKNFIANPRRFFAIGDYEIKLKVSNTLGCEDSVAKSLVLLGPRAQFDFVGDTVGCDPLLVTFKNNSVDATDFIWQFNDVSNASFGTSMDSNVSLQYRGYGNFYPQLIARGLFTKSGVSQVCKDIYPDTSISFKRTVTVLELPKPQFSWTTNCNNFTTSFTNLSAISTGSIVSYQWTFGDGSASSMENPTHVFADTGSYRVVLKVISNQGCEDSLVQDIVISPMPFANFSFNTVCEGSPSFFSDSSFAFNDKIYLWKWEFGDGSTSNFKNPIKLYGLDSTYQVKLKVTNVAGCSDSLTKAYTVYSNPRADYSFDNVCEQGTMNFNNSSTSNQSLQTWNWDFGDGDSAQVWNANHVFNEAGTYPVTLNIRTIWGCKDSITKVVLVYPNPIAKIYIDLQDQCFNYHNFQFTDSSRILSGNTTADWNLGNFDSSSEQIFNYQYSDYGNYTIRLISISDFNCRDTAYDSIRIFAMPLVDFSVNEYSQCSRYNQFTFEDESTIPQGTFTLLWQFGDGDTSVSNPVNHHYADTGVFNPKLILTSDKGCKDSASTTVRIWPMPSSGFTINDSDQCLHGNGFDFTNITDSSWAGYSHRWEFGDSSFSYGQNATHTYTTFGMYQVLLIETDSNNCTDTISGNIVVKPMPEADFYPSGFAQCLNDNSFNFTNTSSIVAGSLSYRWSFGDGDTSVLSNPQHSYADFGVKNVKLMVWSESGCSDSISKNIVIHPMPVPGFSVNDSQQCLRQNQFEFTNASSIFSGSLTHTWTFGDTGVSFQNSPTHIYQNFGRYNVKLISTSNFGCKDSFSGSVDVNPMPISYFIINDSSQCVNNQNFIFTDSSSIYGGTLSREWVFDDGTSSSSSIVNKTFSHDSLHVVKLIQISDKGCRDSLEKMFEVYSKPLPSFTIDDTVQCLNTNNFIFTNGSSIKKGSWISKWKFGDLKTDSNVNTSHVYATDGSYIVTLITTSDNGCMDSVEAQIVVDAIPVVSFSVNDTGQCINDQRFEFNNLSSISVGNLQYIWKFGDGNSSVLIDPVTQYVKDTTYSVLLTATSNKGCKDSTQNMVIVYPKPAVDFAIDDSIQCLFMNNFHFTNLTDIKYGTLTYNWDFGDGMTDTLITSMHSYTASGNYRARLTALSNNGCKDTASKLLTVGAMPFVSFSINDPGQCLLTQDFIYNNTTTLGLGTMTSFWQFGDGDTSTTLNARHIYPATGNYNPKLIMTSNYGCVDSISQSIWVNPNAQVSFVVNDSDQCQNQQHFVFTNTSSLSSGNIIDLLWNLDNGQGSDQEQVLAYYPLSGTYTISLQTTTDSGCIDSFQNSIRVYPKPLARFDVNDSAQCLFDNNYVFTDASFDSLGLNQYNWNINNEVMYATSMVNYVFSTIGYKDITLIATSLRGCSDTIKREVYVKPMPDPSFEKLKEYYCVNTGPFSFITTSPGGNFTGKNIQSELYKPIVLWQDTVEYKVTVNGCTDSSMQITQVYPDPNADLGNDTTICKYEMVELAVQSWQSNFVWNNGSTLPTLLVDKAGKYWVQVSNICGVQGDTIAVSILPVNCRFFLPTAFSPNKDGINDRYKPVIFDVSEMHYQIYTRWGELIFEGNQDDQGWDGSYKGQPAQDGTYLIIVTYAYKGGLQYLRFSETGTFLLLR